VIFSGIGLLEHIIPTHSEQNITTKKFCPRVNSSDVQTVKSKPQLHWKHFAKLYRRVWKTWRLLLLLDPFGTSLAVTRMIHNKHFVSAVNSVSWSFLECNNALHLCAAI